MYFPGELVPVCSKTHINHFLRSLGRDSSQDLVVRANRDLLERLRSVPIPRSTSDFCLMSSRWCPFPKRQS